MIELLIVLVLLTKVSRLLSLKNALRIFALSFLVLNVIRISLILIQVLISIMYFRFSLIIINIEVVGSRSCSSLQLLLLLFLKCHCVEYTDSLNKRFNSAKVLILDYFTLSDTEVILCSSRTKMRFILVAISPCAFASLSPRKWGLCAPPPSGSRINAF